MKQFIKSLIPPILLNTLNRLRNNKYGWKGNYTTWQEAQKDAVGYDSDKIIKAVKTSVLKVKNGEAIYERDSVIFDEIEYSWSLLAGLMYAFANGGGRKVLDFGGSLGSTYYQNKKFLDEFDNLSWNVVEQKHFVDIGTKEIEDNRLKFFYDTKECKEKEDPNILLFSSVLQYIENPYELLDEILQYEFKYILIDRTSFTKDNQEKITLQTVSPTIYEASYPCRFFSEKEFIEYFNLQGYKIIEKFDALDGKSDEYYFQGMIMEKINA